MTAARLVEVADAVAAKLRAANPGVPVLRRYTVEPGKTGPAVRTVWVLPVGYENLGPKSRSQDEYAFTIGVVVAEAMPALPSRDPDADAAAVDARLAFVQAQVFAPLENPRDPPVLPPPCGGCWPQAAAVGVACDPDLLARGVFYSELAVTFHDII